MLGVKEPLKADFRKVEDAEPAERLGPAAPFWLVDRGFTLAAQAP